jgi:putative DNA methylase
MTDNKRLIEVSFPLADVSIESAFDKSTKGHHVRNTHLWWSCKPLPAMRAAIAASLLPPDDASFKLVREVANRRLTGPELYAFPAAKSKVVLDPFGGSGATAIEALRLGASAVVGDLNPVAFLIQHLLIRALPKWNTILAGHVTLGKSRPGNEGFVDLVRRAGARVGTRTRASLLNAYQTPAQSKKTNGDAFAFLWTRTATCENPACRRSVPLTANWWLRKGSAPLSLALDAGAPTIALRIRESEPTQDGTVSASKLQCPYCKQVSSRGYLQAEGIAGRIGHFLAAVTYLDKDGRKAYRVADDEDRRCVAAAESILSARPLGPTHAFPQDDSRKFTPATFGVKLWGDLHNARQTLALSTFASEVKSEFAIVRDEYVSLLDESEASDLARDVCTALACAIARMADLSTICCRWEPQAQAVRNLFTSKYVPMMWDYAEANTIANSSGSWSQCLDRMTKSLDCAPRATGPGTVYRSSASDIPLESDSVDVVLTDPPYYDAIAYGDASDFFYGWHKLAIGDLYPDAFATDATPKRNEIIQRPGRVKTAARFESDMHSALAEVRRVLKPDGLAVVIFAHKSTAAWETLLKATLDAGLVISASWPVETEMPQRADAHGHASLASTVFIVCRKFERTADGFIDDVEPALKARLHERLDYFWSQGIRGADFFMSAIGPAVEVFGRHKRVLKLSGEEVTIGELLDKVRGIVADYALQRIVHGAAAGDVDEASRFYVIWRWAFGTAEVDSGEAIHMAQSMGCEFNELVAEKGVLSKAGDKVSLKGPVERKKVKGLGEPAATGTLAPLIDVLHRAANLWAAGERQDLADFLGTALPQGGADRMQRLAQSIVDVLVPSDKERALYENFLVGSRSLPAPAKKDEGTAKQQKLF